MQPEPLFRDFKTTHSGLKCNYFHISIFLCFIFASLCETLTNHLTFPQILGMLKGQFSAPGLLNIKGCLAQVSLNHATICPFDPVESFADASVYKSSAEGDFMQIPRPCSWDPVAAPAICILVALPLTTMWKVVS